MPHSMIEPATISLNLVAQVLSLLTQVVQPVTTADREAFKGAASLPSSTVPCGCLGEELW